MIRVKRLNDMREEIKDRVLGAIDSNGISLDILCRKLFEFDDDDIEDIKQVKLIHEVLAELLYYNEILYNKEKDLWSLAGQKILLT
jgi:hypothetical protein